MEIGTLELVRSHFLSFKISVEHSVTIEDWKVTTDDWQLITNNWKLTIDNSILATDNWRLKIEDILKIKDYIPEKIWWKAEQQQHYQDLEMTSSSYATRRLKM